MSKPKHCTTAPALKPCFACKFNPDNQSVCDGQKIAPMIRKDGRCHYFIGVIRRKETHRRDVV